MEADKTALIRFFKHIQVMPDAVAVCAAADFEPVSYRKNELLLAQGQVSNDFLFLESGFVRAFTLDTEGNEVTTNFYKPDTIVFEVASFLKRIPTAESFQALNDCTGWKVNYDTFQVLFHSIPEFREFGRANLVNGFIALKERTLSMINLTADSVTKTSSAAARIFLGTLP